MNKNIIGWIIGGVVAALTAARRAVVTPAEAEEATDTCVSNGPAPFLVRGLFIYSTKSVRPDAVTTYVALVNSCCTESPD